VHDWKLGRLDHYQFIHSLHKKGNFPFRQNSRSKDTLGRVSEE